ncbi:MAG: methylated-DNA-[protein]-cysteine S-methyltransferase [archaeon GW2011_AR3]|nr:MAG: methylated-DNA-[protein]-cysteine S-methyltransferase [archaeon GW2011_AR3]MBS3110007.1 MGMT family protein [Candidatus Woesearchaeota archaeon]
MKFADKVYKLCRKIPKGKVSTYKAIAKAMKTKAYRAVGQALRCNPYAPEVPCHRVVASDGSLGGFAGRMNSRKKIMMLKKEGIRVKQGTIADFQKKMHRF